MRLTLRTLLAYMDEILDPADREELSNKIESSEFAADLIHRTRDTVRRLRLGAPEVTGSGIGLDPNTVAEYLDNTLSAESVADFERICLESDIHLGEVASCHHVLTMVLGEPAEVDPNARMRMYALASNSSMGAVIGSQVGARLRVEGAHTPSTSSSATPSADQVEQETGEVAAEVPEYMRPSAMAGYRGLLAALAGVLLLGAAALFATGWKDWFGVQADLGKDHAAPASIQPEMPVVEPIAEPEVETALDGVLSKEGMATADGDLVSSDLRPDSGASLPEDAPPRMVPETADPSEVPEEGMTTPDVPATLLPAEPSPETGDAPEGTDSLAMREEPLPDDSPPSEPEMTEPGEVPSGTGDEEAPTATVENSVPEEKGPVEMGTYLGGKSILLRRDSRTGKWFRLPPRSTVSSGDQLLALPAFRPRITLTNGVHLELSGGTLVTLGTAEITDGADFPTGDPKELALEIVYGRVVLVNTALTNAEEDENPLRLVLGQTVGDVRLGRNATLAVELKRKYVPGHDPRQSPALIIASLIAPEGNLVWEDSRGTLPIMEPAQWKIDDGVISIPSPYDSLPEWIDHEPVAQRSETTYGVPVLERSLQSDQPISYQLLELFQSSQRREVKSLVTRSSVHVGLFAPFIESLRDSEKRVNSWKADIETLRLAMARSPEAARQLRQTLVEQREEEPAAHLYEMLCGYTEEQIGRTAEERQSGALVKLIDWLESDSLDYRVLAWYNLLEITGQQHIQPSDRRLKRAQGIRTWRKRLKKGEL